MTNEELHELVDQQAERVLIANHRTEYENIRQGIFDSISTVLNTNDIALSGEESFGKKGGKFRK